MRQEEKNSVNFKRVESIEVIKFTDRERINKLCEDGYVYDIELEDNHNYLANGILVHNCSAFPKPSKRAKQLKEICKNDVLLMTGTLVPESNSQIFHQLYVSKYSPFNRHKNFYAWFREYGTPNFIYTSYGQSNCYKTSDWIKINKEIGYLITVVTQKEANFESEVQEHFHRVDVNTTKLINTLFKDRIIQGKEEVILADTPAKLMQKVHQLASGTIKFESGNTMVICDNKAKYIKDNFKGKKAIFYKFIAELEAIKKHLDITQDIEEFNTTNKDIALQFVSGREGTNLSKADNLIMYNVDHSAVSYFQSKDRMTVKDRVNNNIHWLFDASGHCENVYKAVQGKKNYTLQTFKKNYELSK